MTTKEIKKATKSMSFESATYFIQNCGLELTLIQDFAFGKMWEVKNNNEISHISNFLKSLTDNTADVKFCFNY